MIRVSRVLSIPHYHEWVPLRNKIRTAAWAAVAGTMVPGFAVAVADSTVASALAQMSVVLGGLVLAGVLRCGRYEVAVGTKRTDLGPDPFRRIVPTGAVESAVRRPATSWRRLFADEEVGDRPRVPLVLHGASQTRTGPNLAPNTVLGNPAG